MEAGAKSKKSCKKGHSVSRVKADGSPRRSPICRKKCAEGKVRDRVTGRCRMKKTGAKKSSPRRRSSPTLPYPRLPYVPYGGNLPFRGGPPRAPGDLPFEVEEDLPDLIGEPRGAEVNAGDGGLLRRVLEVPGEAVGAAGAAVGDLVNAGEQLGGARERPPVLYEEPNWLDRLFRGGKRMKRY